MFYVTGGKPTNTKLHIQLAIIIKSIKYITHDTDLFLAMDK